MKKKTGDAARLLTRKEQGAARLRARELMPQANDAAIANMTPEEKRKATKVGVIACLIGLAVIILVAKACAPVFDRVGKVSAESWEEAKAKVAADEARKVAHEAKEWSLPPSKIDALAACQAEAQRRSSHPSTFKRSLSADWRMTGEVVGTVHTTFKAKNSFNLELEFDVTCLFEGARLTQIEISESPQG